ncbi:MAG TPA: response regulator [Gammaproteobacteria bacterium]|nr:response regulator [Gammaproteobacteria bacterium]
MRSPDAASRADAAAHVYQALAAARLGTWEQHEPTRSTTWSAETLSLLGYEPGSVEPSYEAFIARVHPDDRARRHADFEAAKREHRDIETEYRVIWPNGEVHWLQGRGRFIYDDAGNVEHVYGVIIDIDRQKETEHDLREAHARLGRLADQLRAVAEAAPGTLFTFRRPYEGPPAYLFVGPHLRETHGFSPEDISADPLVLLKYVHPDDLEGFQREIDESVRTLSMWHSQFRHLHPEKGEVWLEIFAHPIADAEGLTWHGIAHDITEHKRTEADLRAARARAEAADKAKSEFLANMSHEIRTPMSAILGYADILRPRLKNREDLQYLQTIYSNGRYLLEIIDDILDLSRIEAGKLELHRERVPPDELVLEVQSLLSLRATAKGLALDVAFEGPLPRTISTDRTRVRQILINLVENAIKFTERGGVRITVQLLPEERIRFDVTDTGIGIRPDILDGLFMPFTQADASLTRRFGGSGLGLSICRALSRKLGGDVTVTTKEGSGSTFALVIPTGDLSDVPLVEPGLANRPRSTAWEITASLSCRVLVVDDHADMRLLARMILEEAGAEVVVASDGEQALAEVRGAEAESRPFDAVLLDLQMPARDGYSTAAELRARGFEGAIIAVTAHARKEDEARCLDSGCDDYLSKPVERARLVNMVGHHTQDLTREERSARRRRRAHDGTVLVVEDNQDTLKLLQLLLEKAGCGVRTASDAASAVSAAKTGPLDAVVLDLGLPDASGAEVLAELQALPECANARFICLSGRSEREVDWRALGFDHFLQKPARFADLRRLLTGNAQA